MTTFLWIVGGFIGAIGLFVLAVCIGAAKLNHAMPNPKRFWTPQ